MKKKIFFIFGLFLLTHCEDPIALELNDTEERLVVEAYINWIKETNTSEQEVILSLSSPYFGASYKTASGATVTIEDDGGRIYTFIEEEKTGRYLTRDTLPYVLNRSYTLHIEYKGEHYSGTESLKAVSSLNRIDQETIDLFGQEAIQLEARAVDPIAERNFSFFEFTSQALEVPEYNVYRDDFNNGGEYYGFLLDQNLKEGDQVRIRQYGLSNIGYNYWYLLILQNTQQGGPFQATPVNLLGNLAHESNPERNPFGYFRLSEVSEINYIIN